MKIALVGGYYGYEEEKEDRAFVGASGYHLTKMLAEAGIDRDQCLLTNVFNLRPKFNKVESLCGEKRYGIQGYPPLGKSKYLQKAFAGQLDRLADELVESDPNIVIALGNEALWALTGKSTISRFRGCVEVSTHTASGFKVIPTYNPAAVLRDWSLRPVVVSDFHKAEEQSHFPETRYPKREIWIEPTLEDLETFYEQHLRFAQIISVDIETSGTRITCIGFATNAGLAIVIPFDDSRRKDRSYWHSHTDECKAWSFVKRVLQLPSCKLFQNGLYDIAFLWRSMKIEVVNAEEDTMLMHHALQPESLKGLGFLGSLYTDERAWKHMRTEHETIKRDD